MQPDGSTSIVIDAPAEVVWEAVTDVTRHPEWSAECERAEWTGGSSAPEVGATFTGYNRVGDYTWEAPCTVVEAERARVFAYRVGEEPDGTVWTWALEPTGSVTKVTHSFHAPDLAKPDYPIPGRDEMLRDGVEKTVAALKSVLEG